LGLVDKPKAPVQAEKSKAKGPGRPKSNIITPTFVQREGEFVKKLGANGQEEVWSTSPEKVFGGDKATLRQFERKYLGI
jgi:hypothetical protein